MPRTHERIERVTSLAAAAALALAVALSSIWGIAAVDAQGSLPDLAEAAPESAVMFHWTDLDREGGQWQQTQELLARVGFPDALDVWEGAVLEEAGGAGGPTSAELDALLGGEMAIVVMPAAVERLAAMAMAGMESHTLFRTGDATPEAGEMASPHGVVAILEPGDLDVAWEYAERQLDSVAVEMGVSVEESTVGEAEVLSLPAREHAAKNGSVDTTKSDGMDHWMGGHGGFAAARAGDFIVAGKSVTDVSEAIDVIEGSAGSLADSPEAQAVLAELPAEALTFIYIDGQGILDALDPEAIAMLQGALMETPVEILASQTGLAVSADQPGFRFETATILNDAVDLDRFTVENDPTVAEAADRAPGGTFAFQAGRLAENAFDGSAFMVAQAVNAAESGAAWPAEEDSGMPFPSEAEMAEEIAAASATLGFDLQIDLFDLLGDEFIAYSSFPSMTFESLGVDAVAALSTTDPDALAEAMERLAAWIDRSDSGVDIVASQVDGDRVYTALSDELGGAPGLEFGVVGDRAVLGLGGGIASLTTQPETTLADDEQFQTVMSLLPNAYYQVGYVDIGQAIDPLITLMGLFSQFSEGGPQALATPEAEGESPRNIRALGAVAFQEGNVSGASAILYIEE